MSWSGSSFANSAASSSGLGRESSAVEKDSRPSLGRVFLQKTKTYHGVANHWAVVVEFVNAWVVIEGMHDARTSTLYGHYTKLRRRPEGTLVPLDRARQYIKSDPEKVVHKLSLLGVGAVMAACATGVLALGPVAGIALAGVGAAGVNGVSRASRRENTFTGFPHGLLVSPEQLFDLAMLHPDNESKYVLLSNNCQTWANKAVNILRNKYSKNNN